MLSQIIRFLHMFHMSRWTRKAICYHRLYVISVSVSLTKDTSSSRNVTSLPIPLPRLLLHLWTSRRHHHRLTHSSSTNNKPSNSNSTSNSSNNSSSSHTSIS